MKKITIFLIMPYLFGQVDYQSEIQTIFDNNCTNCHGSSGGLSLGSYSSLIAGANSGDVIIPGNHSTSLLWQRINDGSMPPSGNLSSSEIDLIADWIDEGALEFLTNDLSYILPRKYRLYQNYPNPFNPSTILKFDIPLDGLVNISIYDVRGIKISTLINSFQNTGSLTLLWDGTDNAGRQVSAGLYFYIIQAGDFRDTKKMVLLK
jgi:hypothetical protein|tara:strand:- start:5645 stop:6262 length:618 start_codon:yes stop_codon:yes gene_type:complete